jgi:alkylresorcinol/alkylpyrone synthase
MEESGNRKDNIMNISTRYSESRILGISTVVPSHSFDQDFAAEGVRQWLLRNGNLPGLSVSRIVQVFYNAGVKSRHSVLPIEEMLIERNFGERNLLYTNYAKELGERALGSLFEKYNTKPSEIDLFITVSCTGFMIPSLDAYLMNRFPFRSDVKRLPINQLGCAAGVASLTIADDYIRSYPGSTVLILSLELCTLNFQPTDKSTDHIISAAIFGDGAAATIVTGKTGSGLHIIKTANRFFPETLDFMGFDLEPSGFHIFLSPRITGFIRENLLSEIETILNESGLDLEEINAWLFHPGGARILEAIEDGLNIDKEKLKESREVLRHYGNLSSATIFFIIDAYLKKSQRANAAYQVVGAVGPGFQLNTVLMEWKESE